MGSMRVWAGRLCALLLVLGGLGLPAVLRPALPSHAGSAGFIIYTTDRVASEFDLFRIRGDGTDDQRITGTLFADEVDPDWSPDGSKVAFVSNQLGSPDIVIMNSDGTGQQLLILDTFRDEIDPDWSPDGTKIAFAWNLRGGQFDIWVADLQASVLVPITSNLSRDERYPAWSPDGHHIAYACEIDDQDEICVVDLETMYVQRLTERVLTHDRQPAWSPDGAYILFTSVEIAGTSPGALPAGHGPDWSLSPLATSTATTTVTPSLTTAPSDTPVPTSTATHTATLTDTPTATATTTPSGTPTGTATPTATPMPIETSSIWIMRADGSDLHKLIDLPIRVFDPAWSPDGARVVFARQRLNPENGELTPPRLYLYDLLTGHVLPFGSSQVPIRGQAPDWIGAIATPATLTPTATDTVPPPPPPFTLTPTATRALPTPSPPPQGPSATPSRTLLPPPPGGSATPTGTRLPPPPARTATPTPTRVATPPVTATPPPPSGDRCQVIQNPGFETGPPAEPWMMDRHGASGALVQQEARRTGQWGLRMGTTNSAWDEARQVVSLVCPDLDGAGARSRMFAELSFWTRVIGTGPATNGDVLNVVLLTSDGRQLLRLIKTLTDQDADGQWHYSSTRFTDYMGQTIQVAISATTDESGPTTFDIDDVRLELAVERIPYRWYVPFIARSRRNAQ